MMCQEWQNIQEKILSIENTRILFWLLFFWKEYMTFLEKYQDSVIFLGPPNYPWIKVENILKYFHKFYQETFYFLIGRENA